MLRILKDLINRLFGFKDKKINKQEPTLVVDNTKNQEGMSENAYFLTIEEHFTLDEDISEEYRNELKNHLKESIEQTVRFIGKEIIEINNVKYKALKFNFFSSDPSLSKGKKLNMNVWYDEQSLIWLKSSFEKMGFWEYRLKYFE